MYNHIIEYKGRYSLSRVDINPLVIEWLQMPSYFLAEVQCTRNRTTSKKSIKIYRAIRSTQKLIPVPSVTMFHILMHFMALKGHMCYALSWHHNGVLNVCTHWDSVHADFNLATLAASLVHLCSEKNVSSNSYCTQSRLKVMFCL